MNDPSKEYEVRLLSGNFQVENRKISGYAAVFDSLSLDLGGFREIIKPGAFTSALQRASLDVRALINHDSNLVLGRSTSNTLRLTQDPTGLLVEIDLPDTSYARDLTASMERGDINQMSFRFYMFEDNSRGQSWSQDGEYLLREISEFAAIDDISIVTYPAYPETSAAIRSIVENKKISLNQSRTNYNLRKRYLNLMERSLS